MRRWTTTTTWQELQLIFNFVSGLHCFIVQQCSNVAMIILGIDPGFQRCGYGIIKATAEGLASVTHGVITTLASRPMPERLLAVVNGLSELLHQYAPDEVAIEQLFFEKNKKTFMRVSQAQGAIIAEVAERGLPIAEYTPLEVKQALTGYGQATKAQVQHMVQQILKLEKRLKIDDTADALAVAICHAASRKLNLQTSGGKGFAL